MPARTKLESHSLNEIPHPSLPEGSILYGGSKLFPDYQAEEGQSYFTLVHGIAHESSVSFVACLQALRALRKGYESVLYFYGPAAMNAMATRGFPTTGDSAFPGEHNINTQIERFIEEGGTVYACRFACGALYGFPEDFLLDGVKPFHPLDVLDAALTAWRDRAFQLNTWTV